MATEDDTFDIDIYGDEPSEVQAQDAQDANGEEYELDFSTTNDEAVENDNSTARTVAGGVQTEDVQNATEPARSESQQPSNPQQGTKRKAPDDGYPEGREGDYEPDNPAVDGFTVSIDARHTPANDPYATPALRLTELQWWTTEEDIRAFCAKARVEDQLKELSFGEHKINGKSRGEMYLEFESSSAAGKVKAEVEKEVKATATESGAKRKEFLVEFTTVGNSFKMAAGGAGPKKDYQQQSYNRGGYNNSDRGNFNNRGNFRGGFQNRGGGFNNRGGMYQQSNGPQSGWGGGNGMMPNMGGAGFNPMMAGMNMMGGFNNMGRGGMMGMNQGGGGMPMMGMNRGGMMGMNMGMMGRGGWNGGFQGNGMGQQGWQGGGGGMQQGNKRAKME
jgi:hypothetical protein